MSRILIIEDEESIADPLSAQHRAESSVHLLQRWAWCCRHF